MKLYKAYKDAGYRIVGVTTPYCGTVTCYCVMSWQDNKNHRIFYKLTTNMRQRELLKYEMGYRVPKLVCIYRPRHCSQISYMTNYKLFMQVGGCKGNGHKKGS